MQGFTLLAANSYSSTLYHSNAQWQICLVCKWTLAHVALHILVYYPLACYSEFVTNNPMFSCSSRVLRLGDTARATALDSPAYSSSKRISG